MRRTLGLLAATAVTAGTFIGFTTSSGGAGASSFPPIPAGPIVVGATTPLSGPTAAYGQSTEESFNGVSLKAFNAENPGGIAGHPVKLVFLDDQGTVTGAVQATNQLVSDKVAAVVTLSYNPEATLQQALILNHNKIPVISDLGYSEWVNTKTYPYNFGVGANNVQEGQAAATWVNNSGFRRIAVLTDGLTSDEELLNALKAGLVKTKSKAHIVTTQQITPDATEVSAQVSALKSANPDMVFIDLGSGYGPVWQAMQTDGMTGVKILSTSGAWYDSFSAMGTLANNAYAPFYSCAPSTTVTYPANVMSLMSQYSAATYGYSTNYRIYVMADSVPFDLLKYAIEKEHSDSPQAIKAGLESIHNQSFLTFKYNYTSANHYGIQGTDKAAVCRMAPPYAGGVGKIPTISTSAAS
jgi:branched-chain amino acid transport system substrate-binding protein